jgi:hypothetical protein
MAVNILDKSASNALPGEIVFPHDVIHIEK